MARNHIPRSHPQRNGDPAVPIEAGLPCADALGVAVDPVVRFAQLYRGRRDIMGTEPGGYLRPKDLKKGVTFGHYRGHLQGRFGLGIYPLMLDGTCGWAAVDIDADDLDRALLLRRLLQDHELSAVVLTSREKGYHVALFFDGWVRAADIRIVLLRLVIEAGLPRNTEVFPKADYPEENSKAAGGYLRLPYLAALPEPGRSAKLKPEPGRRAALDLKNAHRTLSLAEFLDLAEASLADPERVRELAEEMRAEEVPAVHQVAGGNGASPCALPRSQAGIELPKDSGLLGVSPEIETLIRDGWREGCGYRSRSEAQQAVTCALVNVGHEDSTIVAVMTCPTYGISKRALEQSKKKQEDALRRCIQEARAPKLNGVAVVGYNGYAAITALLHRRMLDLKLAPLAWPILAEIVTTIDRATGLSLVSPSTLAKRLGCDPRTVYRYGIGPLRKVGILEAVPLEQTGGRWGRVVHRVAPLLPSLFTQSSEPQSQRGECEIEK